MADKQLLIDPYLRSGCYLAILDGPFDDKRFQEARYLELPGYSIYARINGDILSFIDQIINKANWRAMQAIYWVKDGTSDISVPVGLNKQCYESKWQMNVETLLAKILDGDIDFADYKIESHNGFRFKYLMDYYTDPIDLTAPQKGLSIWLRNKIVDQIRSSSLPLEESIKQIKTIEGVFSNKTETV